MEHLKVFARNLNVNPKSSVPTTCQFYTIKHEYDNIYLIRKNAQPTPSKQTQKYETRSRVLFACVLFVCDCMRACLRVCLLVCSLCVCVSVCGRLSTSRRRHLYNNCGERRLTARVVSCYSTRRQTHKIAADDRKTQQRKRQVEVTRVFTVS